MESNFDNDYTLSYKNVPKLDSPAEYIINLDGTYQSFEQIVKSEPRKTVSEIYDLFFSSIQSLQDILCAYFVFSMEKDNTKVEIYLFDINEYINIQNIKSSSNYSPYENKNDITRDAKAWKTRYNKLINDQKQKLNEILSLQEELNELEEQEISDFSLNAAYFEFIPDIYLETEKIKGRTQHVKVEKYTGILIFDEIKVSKTVPFVQLNNYDEENYFKIYESDTFKGISKIFRLNKYDKKNHMYFIILNTEEFETTKDSPYTEVTYDLEKNKIQFKCKEGDEKKIIRRLQTSFKGFTFLAKNSRKFKLEASMVVYKYNIDSAILQFLFTNEQEIGLNKLFSTYFFIDERELSIADRENLYIKFTSISQDKDEEEFNINPSDATIKFVNEGDNMIIEVTKAKNEKTLEHLLDILSRILTYYKKYEEDIRETIDSIIPPIEGNIKERKRVKKKVTQEVYDKKIDQLRALSQDPDIFKAGSEGYSRRCNCQKQPIIVDENEADDWHNKSFVDKSKVMKRQIGEFPPKADSPNFNFVCPDDEFPYPTVIENKDITTSKKYPYIPCCAKTDTINNPKSDYNKYYSQEETKKTGNRVYEVSTLRSLDETRLGVLSETIENLLNNNNSEKNKTIHKRFGVGKSYNSLIHCVLRAVRDKDYLKLDNYKDKEIYCDNFRKGILTKIPNYMNVVKQEMHTETEQTIKEYILDNRKFFDYCKVYRILEEIFKVNIFVFLPRDVNDIPGFEVPNYALGHIRPFRPNRKTILILKNTGSESEKLEYPQYELIIDIGKKEEDTKNTSEYKFIYGTNTTEIVYNSFFKYIENFVFSVERNEQNIYSIFSRNNPYSKVYWPEILKDYDIVSQNLDLYGKLRNINIRHAKSDTTITLYIPPSQPMNVPIDTSVFINDYFKVISIFGSPSKIIKDGVWYKILDFEYGIFIPCETNSDENFPSSPIIELNSKEVNPIYEYRTTLKYSNMLLDFIIWGLRSNKVLNLNDFLKRKDIYIQKNPEVKINEPPNKLISYITEKGDFSYLSNIWPEYFTAENTVQLYPSLYDKVIPYLERYYTKTDGLSLPPDPYLKNIFKYEWDFKQFNENRVLIGFDHLKNWINIHERNARGELEIYNKMRVDKLGNDLEPFLYFDTASQKMYLIQNVRDNDSKKALMCAEKWRRDKINMGYETSNNLYNEFIPHITYQISASFELFVYDTNGDSDYDDYVCILQYNNMYAAMLEIF
jgi:hypothetical protein